MNRREFLAGTTAAGLLARPLRASAAASRLAFPPLLDASASGAFALGAQAGQTTFAGIGTYPSWGLNQPFLGPTVRMARRPTRARVSNGLDQAITLHWHGMVIPGEVDGGPHQMIAPGEDWQPELDVTQPPATLWYHSHTHGRTAPQVYRGLAGVIQVTDGQDDARGLPSAHGIDDLTLVLQDRRFGNGAGLDYRISMHDRMMGMLGDTMLVNGQVGTTAVVPPGFVRLRLLNGSNARIYALSMEDGRDMHQVATDGGLLPAPVALRGLVLAPGERAEVLVDFSAGPTRLMSGQDPNAGGSGWFQVLPFETDPALPARITRVPDGTGAELPALAAEGAERRTVSLDMGMGPRMMMGGGGHAVNGRPFDMQRIDMSLERGRLQHWTVTADRLLHPFHVHGTRFQVLSENGRPPRQQNRGWKDTVLVNGAVELLMRFDSPAPEHRPYMMHCHILEHEDAGMMAQFAVS